MQYLDDEQRSDSRDTRQVFRLPTQTLALRQRLLDTTSRVTQAANVAETDMEAANHPGHTPRLSMPLDSDDSGSEPEISVIEMARSGRLVEQDAGASAYEDEIMSQEHSEAEDTSIEGIAADEQGTNMLLDPAAVGLKEISNLGRFTVSSHKPGNGVEELRNESLKLYWQSDGPQPHRLTIYFVKRVGIRVIRFYVDSQEDESYTPTKIVFKAGTSENNLIEFATMNLENPYGWQDVPIAGAGGDPDGNTLVSYVLQMQILENHQNGKDTHMRGIKIYAFDPDSGHGMMGRHTGAADDLAEIIANVRQQNKAEEGVGTSDRLSDVARSLASTKIDADDAGFSIPEFMREPEIR